MTKNGCSSRARSTPQVTITPIPQKTSAGASSANENGKRPPPGKARHSKTSTPLAATTVAAGATKRRYSEICARPKLASSSASNRNATGLAASVSAANAANRHHERRCTAHTASSASATPRANGNAADRTIPAHTTANVRDDQRVVGPHCRQQTTANASAAAAIVATASSRIPSSAASG